MNNKYKYFERVVFRTPLYSFDNACNNNLLASKEFNEAIRLASPELHVEKLKEDKLGAYSFKMKQSLYKYLSRGAFRCTPFALFAGCSIAKISDKTEIKLSAISNNRRVTRLDMNFLGLLVQEISKMQLIKEQLRFFPNDSIYELGGAKRYIEYYFIKTNRIHKISSIEPNEYLENILNSASSGIKYSQLLNIIKDDEIEKSEIVDFIDDIINSQLLKSELELSVTGEDQLSKIIAVLESLIGCEDISLKLRTIKNILEQIDSNQIGDTIDLYEKIEDTIKEMGIEFERKYLFQTDMFKPILNAQISRTIAENIYEGIEFLNRMTPKYTNESIKKFIKDFQERYEGVEMPLLEVMDAELGIGYGGTKSMDENPLLDKILYKMQGDNARTQVNSDDTVKNTLLKKYMDCIKNGEEMIDISDIYSKEEEEPSWDNLPLTMFSMCSVVSDGKVLVRSANGSSAANLLGRFCHLDSEIEDLCKEITQKEQELNANAIFAEIVHLPSSRIGNILFRPILREYEIPYLSNIGTVVNKAIPLSDIVVSVFGGMVVLKSKRLGKEVIPRLSTAHNYSMSTLPVYRFLCELQNQNIRGGVHADFSVFDAFDFSPRVIYKNCILSKKKWRVTDADFKDIFDKTIEKKKDILASYIKEKHIPMRVDIPDGDNELFIDFGNDVAIEIFLKLLKTRKALMLEEVLFGTDDFVVKDGENRGYTNEFIFTLYKNIEKS